MDPEEALDRLREAGFAEGMGCCDARAGPVELDTLTADTVIFVTEQETPLSMGDATDLWESYQNGSIRPVDDKP